MKPTQPLHGRLGSPSQIAPRKGKVSGARAALEALQWTDAQVDTMPWIWLAIAIRVIPMQSIPCHPVQQMRVMDSMFHVKPSSCQAFKRQRPMPWVDRENEEWAVWACPLGCVVVRPMGSCELNDRQIASASRANFRRHGERMLPAWRRERRRKAFSLRERSVSSLPSLWRRRSENIRCDVMLSSGFDRVVMPMARGGGQARNLRKEKSPLRRRSRCRACST
jgi:hypothetical protein